MPLTLAVIWRPIGPNGRTVVDSIHTDDASYFGRSANEKAVAKFDAIKDLPGVAFAGIVNARDLVCSGACVLEHGALRHYQSNEPNDAPISSAIGGLINSRSADWF